MVDDPDMTQLQSNITRNPPPTSSWRGTNKLIFFILCISLCFNVVHILNGQISALQLSMYESSEPKEFDCGTSMGESSSGEPTHEEDIQEPIRFIAVGGPYHTGSTNIWYSINANIANGVASSRNITLGVFPAGYPPCGVPLFQNFDVDMQRLAGNSSGITDQNKKLNEEWGTMWRDWKTAGKPPPKKVPPHEHLGAFDSPAYNIEDELPLHKSNKIYSWWKHTPPQHPMINCFRADTLYVIMVRHPIAWKQSTMKTKYDLKYDSKNRIWKMDRTSPRRPPFFELQFKSLYHAWAYYMNGYLGWESVSAQKNCYASTSSNNTDNCLGGQNNIPSSRRSMILVRQEDYSYDPQRVLAEIFDFATRGAIDSRRDKDLFVLSDGASNGINHTKEMDNKVKSGYFAAKDLTWEGASKLPAMCERLGYSCDSTPSIFIE